MSEDRISAQPHRCPSTKDTSARWSDFYVVCRTEFGTIPWLNRTQILRFSRASKSKRFSICALAWPVAITNFRFAKPKSNGPNSRR